MEYDLLIGIDGGGTYSAAAWPDGQFARIALGAIIHLIRREGILSKNALLRLKEIYEEATL